VREMRTLNRGKNVGIFKRSDLRRKRDEDMEKD
jgi:hypothetical protein